MSNDIIDVEGSVIRQALRSKGLPGGTEKICCGGKKKFNRDYEAQLRRLGWKGKYRILENGVTVDKISTV